MTTNFKHLLILTLCVYLVLPASGHLPSGGVLSLDGVDDYAVLSFDEHGYLFRKNTRAFTVEMWFYPKSDPDHGENAIIFSQQVYSGIAGSRVKCKGIKADEICFYAGIYLDGEDTHGVTGFYQAFEKDKWNYIAIIFHDRTIGRAYNNWIWQSGKTWFMDRITAEVQGEHKGFFVGGYDEEGPRFRGAPLDIRFHGEIDAIRFSRVARYNLPDIPGVEEPFDPPHRFSWDRDTVALWNFDERGGTKRFEDAAKKGRFLIGMNGAATSRSRTLSVRPTDTSVTTTWGQIKSRGF